MKAIFPLLLCYVLMTAQSFALSGGPVFGSGSVNTIGTYGGVLTPTADPGNPLSAANALGLFSLSVPSTGLASGRFLLFSDGALYTGRITASVDQDSGQLLGVVQGDYSVVVDAVSFDDGTSAQETQVLASAFGKVNAKVKPSKPNAFSSARISGSALIDITPTSSTSTTVAPPSSETLYTINGFRQSQTATSSSSTGTATGTTGGGTTTGGGVSVGN